MTNDTEVESFESEKERIYAGALQEINFKDIKFFDSVFREDFGDVEDLALSILNKGLIHPIVLDQNYRLIAGRRRYQAIKYLRDRPEGGPSKIPCIIRHAKSELDSREVELLENIMRKDLEWQEKAALTAKINQLYTEKEEDWTQADTAKLLGRSEGTVSDHLTLAAAAEAIPEIKKAKTEDEAKRALHTIQRELALRELKKKTDARLLREEEGQSLSERLERLLDKASNSYIISDVFDGLAKLETEDFYLKFAEVDPPYAVKLKEKKRQEAPKEELEQYIEIPEEEYVEFLNKLAKELFRVLSPQGTFVFWYGQQWYQEVVTALTSAGFLIDPIPGIWTKKHGQTNQVRLYLARAYETFIYGRKPDNPYGVTKSGRINIFEFDRVYAGDKYHPTQRPVKLMEEIIDTFGGYIPIDKSKILIPFMGSGVTWIAANNLGYPAFGYDLNGKYKESFLFEIRKKYEEKFYQIKPE